MWRLNFKNTTSYVLFKINQEYIFWNVKLKSGHHSVFLEVFRFLCFYFEQANRILRLKDAFETQIFSILNVEITACVFTGNV